MVKRLPALLPSIVPWLIKARLLAVGDWIVPKPLKRAPLETSKPLAATILTRDGTGAHRRLIAQSRLIGIQQRQHIASRKDVACRLKAIGRRGVADV